MSHTCTPFWDAQRYASQRLEHGHEQACQILDTTLRVSNSSVRDNLKLQIRGLQGQLDHADLQYCFPYFEKTCLTGANNSAVTSHHGAAHRQYAAYSSHGARRKGWSTWSPRSMEQLQIPLFSLPSLEDDHRLKLNTKTKSADM